MMPEIKLENTGAYDHEPDHSQNLANETTEVMNTEVKSNNKGIFFYETRQKIFSLLGGKIEFEFWPLRQCWAVGPIQI